MIRPIFYFFFIFLTFSCGGPDDGPPPVTPVNPVGTDGGDGTGGQGDGQSPMVTVDIDGTPDLDLEALSVVSSIGGTDINSDGQMEDMTDKENPDLPVLFTKEGEVLMGYFPETLEGSEVGMEDIVYFFFKTFPPIAVKRLEDSTLEGLLVNSAKYGTMVDLVKGALNQNASVVDNPLFDELVREIVAEYDGSSGKTAKDIVAEFKFDYSREGLVSIPREAPLFSSLGVQINKVGSSGAVYGPELLGTKSLVLSPGSLFNFILENYILPEESPTMDFQFPEDGTYEVVFSNGSSGYLGLDNKIRNQNYSYFAVSTLGYIVPFGIEGLYKQNKCADEITGLLEVSRQYAKNLVESQAKPTPEDFIEFLGELSQQTTALAICYTSNSSFLSDLIGFANKRLSVAEDIAELTFFARDFLASDISGIETRYFKDGISVGYLNETKVSATMFEGQTGQSFTYESLIEEREISYDVDRGLTSSFIPKEEMGPAIGLPFEYTQTGDVSVSSSNPVISDNEGKVKFDMALGQQDSEITLVPKFESPRISETPIGLTVKEERNEEDLTNRVLSLRNWLWYNSIRQTFSATFFEDGTCNFNAFGRTNGTWSLEGNTLTAHFDETTNDWDFDFQGVYNQDTNRFEGDVIQTVTDGTKFTFKSEFY